MAQRRLPIIQEGYWLYRAGDKSCMMKPEWGDWIHVQRVIQEYHSSWVTILGTTVRNHINSRCSLVLIHHQFDTKHHWSRGRSMPYCRVISYCNTVLLLIDWEVSLYGQGCSHRSMDLPLGQGNHEEGLQWYKLLSKSGIKVCVPVNIISQIFAFCSAAIPLSVTDKHIWDWQSLVVICNPISFAMGFLSLAVCLRFIVKQSSHKSALTQAPIIIA
jgi:hypothetical protein